MDARPRDLCVDASGLRLDQFLVARIESLSRGRAQQLIDEGRVRVERASGAGVPARQVRPSYRVQAGERVRVEIPAPLPADLDPEDRPLTIVYEDDEMLVLDKSAGIAVHPAPGHESGTLVQALLARYPNLPGINGVKRPGIVHRLDLNTSGLLMVAKSERAQRSLTAQLAEHRVAKGYFALLSGMPVPAEGVIDAPIGRDRVHRQRMAIVRGGRSARTRYSMLRGVAGHALVLAQPETGRTHQIRVHFAAIGQPLLGDRLYGGDMRMLSRQFLHASLLRFARPSDGVMIACESPLPPDLGDVLARLLDREHGARREGASAGELLELARARFRHG